MDLFAKREYVVRKMTTPGRPIMVIAIDFTVLGAEETSYNGRKRGIIAAILLHLDLIWSAFIPKERTIS